VLGIALAILADMGLFLFLVTRLPRVSTPWRRVLKGTLLGAVGFEILKVVGSLLVERTTKNPVYGAFAVIVGLLIWINLVSRFTLFVAAWTVTAPYDTDVAPSGTASEEMAKKADIPTEFADNDPDDPPTMLKDGAPAPLANAVQGKTPPQDEPTGKESTDELVGADDGRDSSAGPPGSGGGPDSGVRTNDTGDGSSSGRPVRGDAAQPARRDTGQSRQTSMPRTAGRGTRTVLRLRQTGLQPVSTRHRRGPATGSGAAPVLRRGWQWPASGRFAARTRSDAAHSAPVTRT